MMALTPKTERDNFCRFGQGIVGTGSSMARDVLTSYILPDDLSKKVRPGHSIWSSLDKHQKELIQKAAKDGYKKFDITLTYKLLRYVCTNLNDPSKPNLPAPTQGWGKAPKEGNTTISDDLERLRILRNSVYAHVSNPSLPDTEYQTHWQELKRIAHRMKNHLTKDYLAELQKLEVYKMSDAEIKDLINAIREHREDVKEWMKKCEEKQKDIHKQQETMYQGMGSQIASLDKRTDDHGQLIQALGKRVQKQQDDLDEMRKPNDSKPDVSELKQRVFDINFSETKMLPVSPLQHADKLPIDLLYASVVIQENHKYTYKGNRTRKAVKSPTDLLYMDGKLARRVYMVGDAAHGKTTYCLWLLKHWCNYQNTSSSRIQHNEWETCLGQFDFVFFVKFRYLDPSSATLTQMIQQTITEDNPSLREALEYVLGSERYHCLVILDGLDEWNPHQDAIKQLRFKGFPNIGNLLNCVIFTTMRLWRLQSVAETLKGDHRIVEIQGLDKNGFRTVTKKMLVNHFGLKEKSAELKEKFNEIMEHTENETLRSFTKIPLLAVVCVQLWVKKKQVKNSMTSFYAAMVDMLIERASMVQETKSFEDKTLLQNFPKILRENLNIQSFQSILIKLGKIAYEGLLAEKTSLVFQKKKLELEVGGKELQFALDVGLISQQEAPSLTTRNISVHFFHKSVQEFLAALYIVTDNEVGESFCKHLFELSLMKEMSNVIMFVCGFCPALGCNISETLISLTEQDRKILVSRKYMFLWNTVIEQIYKMQVSWYRELKHLPAFIDGNSIFHVSDVYVDPTYQESIEAFLMDRHVSIKTLAVKGDYGQCITNEILNDFMANTRSLVSLFVDGKETSRFVHSISIPSIERLQLFNIQTNTTSTESPFLSHLPSLRKVEINELVLGERILGLSSEMINLEEVTLQNVQMSEKAWSLFVESLLDIQHKYSLELRVTNID